CAREAEEAYW
nr:immunoglobulin heavy chain junction region [Mus musculus]